MLTRRLPRPQSLGPAWLLRPFSSSPIPQDQSPPPSKLPPRAGPPPSQLSRLKAHLSRLQIADNLPLPNPDPGDHPGTAQWRPRAPPGRGQKWALSPPPSASHDGDDQAGWVKNVRRAADKAKLQAKDLSVDPATVLLLKDLSRSLVASDLYRISHQPGKHIGGWTSGLVDALPRLDPATLEPSGQWFLHFDSPASAALWCDNATRRRRLAFDLHRPARSARIVSDPQAYADARGFSLTAPDVLPVVPLRGSTRPHVMAAFARAVSLRQLLRSALRSDSMVVVSLEGGGDGDAGSAALALTSAQLRALVQDDAAEAGYEWSIVRMRQWGRPGRKKQDNNDDDDDDDDDDDEDNSSNNNNNSTACSSSRFVVSFVGDHDAHRFRRWWHRKRVHLTGDPQHSSPSVMTFNVHKI